MRQVLKRKFFAILNEGVHLPDDSFEDLQNFFENHARMNGLGPYREMAEQDPLAAEDGEQEAGMEGVEAEAEAAADGPAYPPKRKLATVARPGKHTPKPKALARDDRQRSRSRFSVAGEGSTGTPSVQPQTEDTIMEHEEET